MKRFCNFRIALATAALLGVGVSAAKANTYTFTTFDASTQFGGSPGFTTATGINNSGQVVGYIGYQNPLGAPIGGSGSYDGFIYNSGTFTKIDVPGSQSNSTLVSGINNSGQITGTYTDANNTQTYGFVTNGTNYASGGSYTQLDAPSAHVGSNVGTTNGSGFNNSGVVVGSTGFTSAGGTNGFAYNTGATTYTPVNVPLTMASSNSTLAQGVNDAGHIVGYYLGIDGLIHGFIDIAGSFTALDAPFAPSPINTYALGVNNSDVVVGAVYDGAGNTHGFVEDGGVYTEIDVPGGPDNYNTEITGINDNGVLVGFFQSFNTGGGVEGFIATPIQAPEPATLAVLGVGLAGLLAAYRRRPTLGSLRGR